MGLVVSTGASDPLDVAGAAGIRASQRLQVLDALGAGDEPRVGDRVGGASEQVCQAERFPEGAGEDGEGEVEAAADLPEQVAEELVSRSQTAAWADPASPWRA